MYNFSPDQLPSTSVIKNFLRMIVDTANKRTEEIILKAWGKERRFIAYDLYDDTFIFEKDIENNIKNKDSIILVPKSALVPPTEGKKRRIFGNVMTVSTGNHAVTSIPLLSGQFWDLSDIPEESRAEILTKRFVCANCVGDTFEISQRDVSTGDVVEMDDWLQALGCPMRNVVLLDRVDSTLQYYFKHGQEWRIKPLAWTPEEMEAAVRDSVSHMHSFIKYYHNVKGVHFLTYSNFIKWGEFINTKYDEFLRGLNELAGVSEGAPKPNILLQKYRGHHEIEFFGLPENVAESTLIPTICDLYEYTKQPNISINDVAERFNAIAEVFKTELIDPSFTEESSDLFLQTIYRNITGQVYFDDHFNMSSAFDDMRTALPGVTYMLGNRFLHDGADSRTTAILDSLEHEISHGDKIEYVNIYEIRSLTENTRLGEGKSREIVYKTLWSPKDSRVIEKRLAQRNTGYGAYTLARVSAFRSLGISYGKHRLLARNSSTTGNDLHYFTRSRYPGIPFSKLPKMCFYDRDPRTGKYDTSHESSDIVRVLMVIMGGAAAENLILKKYREEKEMNRFCHGKEIIEFGYDYRYGKEMPIRMHLCSIRGTMGWPDTSCTEENINRVFNQFISSFAQMVRAYADQHPSVPDYSIADAFFDGFSAKTRELYWNYINRREQFDNYDPKIYGDFKFLEKWKFVLWSLEQQRLQIDKLYEIFQEKFNALSNNENNNN